MKIAYCKTIFLPDNIWRIGYDIPFDCAYIVGDKYLKILVSRNRYEKIIQEMYNLSAPKYPKIDLMIFNKQTYKVISIVEQYDIIIIRLEKQYD